MLRTIALHHNGNQRQPVPFGVCHKCIACLDGITCFAADGILIIIDGIGVQHLVLSMQIAGFCL